MARTKKIDSTPTPAVPIYAATAPPILPKQKQAHYTNNTRSEKYICTFKVGVNAIRAYIGKRNSLEYPHVVLLFSNDMPVHKHLVGFLTEADAREYIRKMEKGEIEAELDMAPPVKSNWDPVELPECPLPPKPSGLEEPLDDEGEEEEGDDNQSF